MRKLLVFLFLFFLCLFFPHQTYADDHFLITTQANYAVSENGTTHVKLNVVLENVTSQFYAASYTMSLGLPNIDNLQASDTQGVITAQIKQNADGQDVTVAFNKTGVGLGAKNTFSISFDTPDIASHVGKVWEINIPGISNQSEFESFNVHVDIPPSFGNPAYIKPETTAKTLDFTKDQLGSAGISIGFGTEQTYQFFLTYHLQNKNVIPITTEIALPPSTNYQNVAITKMLPKPLNIVKDTDGNWMARYYLIPSQTINVTVEGLVEVSVQPSSETLSEANRSIYLSEQPYWGISNDKINSIAQSLKTPEAIYDYVVHHLSYDYSRVTAHQIRLGSVNVLANPKSAVCLEFTDLFIALSRAAGIPSREIDGYAYTQNSKQRPLSLIKDVLHAWPEYYDSAAGRWIMVDPTWGNTTSGIDYFHTLDFDHFSFVIKGEHSVYPIPAGGYKLVNQEDTKDVQVIFASIQENTKPQFSLTIKPTANLFNNPPVQGTIHIENTGTTLLPHPKIVLTGTDLSPKTQTLSSPDIIPFGFVDIPFSFHKSPLLTKTETVLTIQIGSFVTSRNISFYPNFTDNIFLLGGGLLGTSLIVIISIIAFKPRHIHIP